MIGGRNQTTGATHVKNVHAFAAFDSTSPLRPMDIQRREPGPHDIAIDILYCGVCHSDLHMARNEWRGTTYPVVPGHEIVGRVKAVGAEVTRMRPGDIAAVGCLVDSCRQCPSCRDGLQQYCEGGATFTYNSPDKHSGGMTYGGYSTSMVVDEKYVLRVPETPNLAAVAPLLCAGITTYSPLRNWDVGKGQRVGIVGLGGLGHMGLKLAREMGAHVVLFTTSPGKAEDARRLGAHEVVISKNDDDMSRFDGSLDFILDTVSASHALDPYLSLLKRDGTMCLLGAPDHPHPAVDVNKLIFRRRCLAGSLIGGIPQTQEMLDFCHDHGIVSDIELIPMQNINEAYERMLRSDVKYRFVIDMSTLA